MAQICIWQALSKALPSSRRTRGHAFLPGNAAAVDHARPGGAKMLSRLGLAMFIVACGALASCADAIPQDPDPDLTVSPQPDPDRPHDDILLHLHSYRKAQFTAERMLQLLAAEQLWCDLQPEVAELRSLLNVHDAGDVWRTLATPATGDDIRAVELIAQATAEARGLPLDELPDVNLISRTSLRHYACLSDETWEESQDDDRSVGRPASRLALIIGQTTAEYGEKEQIWLRVTLVVGWYGEVAGAEDMAPGADGVGEIVLVSHPSMPSFYARTVSHEMVHFLQDQWTGWRLHDWYREAETTDQLQALRWLVEGDATLNELDNNEPPLSELLADIEWGPEEHAELDLWRRAYQSLAPMESETIYSAYSDAIRVLADLRSRSGQEAIDALLRDPPRSVEQLMHAEKLEAGELPITLSDLSRLRHELFSSDAWTAPIVDRMGEHWLQALIATASGRPDIAERAAAGWGGDQMVLWQTHDGDITVVTWQIVFDDPHEHSEGVAGLRRWFYSHSYNEAEPVARDLLHWDGPNGSVNLITQPTAVWLVASRNEAVADHVTAGIRNRQWTDYWASP